VRPGGHVPAAADPRVELAWLVDAIVRPRAPAAVRLAPTAVTARAGLEVYRHAYRARLEECLGDDFPAVRASLGEARFAGICAGVVRDLPSRRPTLNAYGAALPRWLGARIQAGERALRPYRDLARVEWALVEAIHEPLAPTVDQAAAAAVPALAWPDVRFEPVPSLRMCWTAFDPEPSLRALRAGGPVPVPPLAGGLSLVHRDAEGLHRDRIPGSPGRLARSLLRGERLGAALESWRVPAAGVHDLLRRLVAGGIIHRIILP
jgi:hypothetical protein